MACRRVACKLVACGPSYGILVQCWVIWAPSWAILAPCWGILAPFWDHLGAFLGHVGASWLQLGAILGLLSAMLGSKPVSKAKPMLKNTGTHWLLGNAVSMRYYKYTVKSTHGPRKPDGALCACVRLYVKVQKVLPT